MQVVDLRDGSVLNERVMTARHDVAHIMGTTLIPDLPADLLHVLVDFFPDEGPVPPGIYETA